VSKICTHLHNEDHGRNEVKDEGGMPHIELGNLASFQNNALAQIVGGNKSHIPTE